MNAIVTETQEVVLERDLSHPPERVWRALTEPALIADWLMPAEFRAEVGHRFAFVADWGRVDCAVLAVEPPRLLAYSWGDGALDTVVTWTLAPTASGTRLRMEQAGFRPGQPRYLHGARAGWPRFLDRLADVLARTA